MSDSDGYTGRDNLSVMEDARNYNDFLVQKILRVVRKDDYVVDFGAGSGTFSSAVRPACGRLLCIEADDPLSTQLKAKGLDVARDFGNVPDNSVDVIYSLNVLEHIENDEGILRLWHAKLNRGGRIFVYVPAFQCLFSAMDAKVGHIRRYSLQELTQKLRSAGFTVEDARYADSLGFAASLLYKVVGNKNGDINPTMLRLYDRYLFPVSRVFDFALSKILGKNVFATCIKTEQ